MRSHLSSPRPVTRAKLRIMDATSAERNLAMLPSGPGSFEELARDLNALGGAAAGATSRWVTRPAVLRRIALALAEDVPAETTRIVVAGEGGTALGVALSLTTGLPFAVIDGDHSLELGELHHGEVTALRAVHEHDLGALEDAPIDLGGSSAKCVFGSSQRALFAADADGRASEVGAR